MPNAFEIPIHNLDAGGQQFRFPVRAAWILGALEGHEATAAGADGELDVRVSRSGNDVVVNGSLRAELAVPCARCLAQTRVHIDNSVAILMVPRPAITGSKGIDDEYEFREEEASVLGYDGDCLVLDEFVRDELVLEIPMIPLCSEDCTGMSSARADSTDALDPNGVDPRLRPLLQFKINVPKKID